jgi:hypothetical protein
MGISAKLRSASLRIASDGLNLISLPHKTSVSKIVLRGNFGRAFVEVMAMKLKPGLLKPGASNPLSRPVFESSLNKNRAIAFVGCLSWALGATLLSHFIVSFLFHA